MLAPWPAAGQDTTTEEPHTQHLPANATSEPIDGPPSDRDVKERLRTRNTPVASITTDRASGLMRRVGSCSASRSTSRSTACGRGIGSWRAGKTRPVTPLPTLHPSKTRMTPRSHDPAKRGDTRRLLRSENPRNRTESRMDRPPPHVHGKEGVDGSSPSEGLQNPRSRRFFVQDDLLFVARAVGMEPFMELSRSRLDLFAAKRRVSRRPRGVFD